MTVFTPGMICTHRLSGDTLQLIEPKEVHGSPLRWWLAVPLSPDGGWAEKRQVCVESNLAPCDEPMPGDDDDDPPVIEEDGFVTVDTARIVRDMAGRPFPAEQVVLVADDGHEFVVNGLPNNKPVKRWAKGLHAPRGKRRVKSYFTEKGEAPPASNDRLIAAAPDLLEAARRALSFIDTMEDEIGETLKSGEMLRAAIAKATGDTP